MKPLADGHWSALVALVESDKLTPMLLRLRKSYVWADSIGDNIVSLIVMDALVKRGLASIEKDIARPTEKGRKELAAAIRGLYLPSIRALLEKCEGQ